MLPGTEPVSVLWPFSSTKYEFQVISLGGTFRNATLFVGDSSFMHSLVGEQNIK